MTDKQTILTFVTILVILHLRRISGALAVGGMLIGTGAGIGYTALTSVLDMTAVLNVRGMEDTAANVMIAAQGEMNDSSSMARIGALSVSGVSVVIKEMLFRYTIKAGKAANSSTGFTTPHLHPSYTLHTPPTTIALTPIFIFVLINSLSLTHTHTHSHSQCLATPV